MPKARWLLTGLAAALGFAVVAFVLLRVMPQPLRPVDFLMIGAIATLAALAILFGGVMLLFNQSEVFFKRRKRD